MLLGLERRGSIGAVKLNERTFLREFCAEFPEFELSLFPSMVVGAEFMDDHIGNMLAVILFLFMSL